MSPLISDSNSHTHSAPARPYTSRDDVHSAGTEIHQAIEFQPNNSCISARLKTTSAIHRSLPLLLSFLLPAVGDNVTIVGSSKLAI